MYCFTEAERKMVHDPLMYCSSFTEETEGKMEQDPLMYSRAVPRGPRQPASLSATKA
jgi:hypothetical protein